MKSLDKSILWLYICAMTVLVAMGNCEYDVPIFLIGAVAVFIVAAIMQSRNHRPSDDDE